MTEYHPHYLAALDADRRYSEVIKVVTSGRRDRWTLTIADRHDDQIEAAYQAKVEADRVWLETLQHQRGRV